MTGFYVIIFEQFNALIFVLNALFFLQISEKM